MCEKMNECKNKDKNVKKIVPCMDIKSGKVVKGVKFKDIKELRNPVDLAKYYNESGADELVFYDIAASVEGHGIQENLFMDVRKAVNIPLIAGGGLIKIEDCDRIMALGADKISINTGALKNPELIKQAAEKYGREKVMLSVDVSMKCGSYHIFKDAGTVDTGLDAMDWIDKCVSFGAGEVVVNSIDMDGVQSGYDIALLKKVCRAVNVPVIASGGAGKIEDFIELFNAVPTVQTALAASVFHTEAVKIDELKKELKKEGIEVVL